MVRVLCPRGCGAPVGPPVGRRGAACACVCGVRGPGCACSIAACRSASAYPEGHQGIDLKAGGRMLRNKHRTEPKSENVYTRMLAKVGGLASERARGRGCPRGVFFGSCRSPPRVCSLAHTRPRPPAVQVPGAPHVRDVQRPGLQAPVHEQVEPAADGPRARPPVHEGCVRRCERTRVPAGARGAAA
jgi:hypothetical protein